MSAPPPPQKPGFGQQGSGYNNQGSGYNNQGSGYNNNGSGYNNQGSGYNMNGGNNGFNNQGSGFNNNQGGGMYPPNQQNQQYPGLPAPGPQGPSFAQRWLQENNPINRVEKLLPQEKAYWFNRVMGAAFVMGIAGIIDLAVGVTPTAAINLLHLFTVIFPSCDFIVDPLIYALFTIGAALISIVGFFIALSADPIPPATTNNSGEAVLFLIVYLVGSGGIVFWLNKMDEKVEERLKNFTNGCTNPGGDDMNNNGGGPNPQNPQNPFQQPMQPPPQQQNQPRQSTARRFMQSIRYTPSMPPPPQKKEQGGGGLPPGWQQAREAQTGDIYYFHEDGRTQWDRP